MTKKDISGLYFRRYKRPASANEIIFYELYKMEITEGHFTKDEKKAVLQESERQFGKPKSTPQKNQFKIKIKKSAALGISTKDIIEIELCSPSVFFSGIDMTNAKKRLEIISTNVAENRNKHLFGLMKYRCEMMKKWHIEKNIEIPDDMQAVFTRYGV